MVLSEGFNGGLYTANIYVTPSSTLPTAWNLQDINPRDYLVFSDLVIIDKRDMRCSHEVKIGLSMCHVGRSYLDVLSTRQRAYRRVDLHRLGRQRSGISIHWKYQLIGNSTWSNRQNVKINSALYGMQHQRKTAKIIDRRRHTTALQISEMIQLHTTRCESP